MSIKKILLTLIMITFCGCNSNDHLLPGYVEGLYTYISPTIGGKLEVLKVSRGDKVNANDLLFVLDQQPETDQLKQAQNNLAKAEETLTDLTKGQRQTIIDQLNAQREQVVATRDLDKLTLDRYTILYKQGAITKNTLDIADRNYQVDLKKIKEIDANLAEANLGARENQITAQEAVVKAANAEVLQAQWSLEQKTKYAPVTGQVFDTYYRIGEFVPAGQPVVSMLAPENIKIIFFLPETMLSKIKIGQKIKFNCDNCKTAYPATISFISSKAEYTPPVIYSRSSRDKLVYRIEATVTKDIALLIHAGQPIDVFLTQ